MAGHIVILSGPSRSGKSSIVAAMQDTFDEPWMNIGMDNHIAATPATFRPGVGLRPRRPEDRGDDPARVPIEVLEEYIPRLYGALYASIAAHARLGLNVVADLYHHEFYSRPLRTLDEQRHLDGLPFLFVGVGCPIDEIWRRREATWGQKRDEVDDGVRLAVELHDQAARALDYDLEFDTSLLTPQECAARIREALRPSASPSA